MPARRPLPPASADSAQTQPQTDDAPLTTMWKHSETSRFWISGQENVIVQGHPAFAARYSGLNSLEARGEARTSFLTTLFLGVEPVKGTEVLLDITHPGYNRYRGPVVVPGGRVHVDF